MRKSQGFTLIELMITVAIVAILAGIVFPSYSEYIRRSRLTEATSQLAGMRVKMEQFFQDNRTYVGACAAGVAPKPVDTPNFVYTCPNASLTGTGYLVRATGAGTMLGFTYTIDQANVHTTELLPSGWNGTGAACWVIRKDGSC